MKAKCLALSTITKRKELLGSKHTQAILSLASVVSFLEKRRRLKGVEKLDQQLLKSYIAIFGDKDLQAGICCDADFGLLAQ